MRAYESSHPWLAFSVDARRFPARLWVSLGEAQSKCEHLRGAPLLPEVSQSMHVVYLAKGVMATTAIEGNTLTEEQVRQLVEGKLRLPPTKDYQRQEVLNIVDACNVISRGVLAGGTADLCVEDINNFNRMVLKDLPLAEYVVPGEVSQFNVTVGRYRGAPREDCALLLTRLCEFLADIRHVDGLDRVATGIIRAIIAHIYLAWIHPYGDGNGRTARLLEFQILLSAGVPTVASHLLSNHYNDTRPEYYQQLDRASRSGGDIVPFIEYAINGFIEGLRLQIDQIVMQQTRVLWDRHVYDTFREKRRAIDKRRRDLMLWLSAQFFEQFGPVNARARENFTADVAVNYANVDDRAIVRDLNLLAEMGLIAASGGGYMPLIQQMTASPPRALLNDPD